MSAREDLLGHRRFPRVSVALPVIGHGALESPALPGIVRNVSRAGLLAVFRVALPPGTELRLLLQTPHGALELAGQVVWAAPRPDGAQHGIAFREPQDLAFVQRLCATPSAPEGIRSPEPSRPKPTNPRTKPT